MLNQLTVKERVAEPLLDRRRFFAPEEITWLCNEANILRMTSPGAACIHDPDLRAHAFRRLAYHPRLLAAVGGPTAGAVASTAIAYAGANAAAANASAGTDWTTLCGEASAQGSLAIVFLEDATLEIDGSGRPLSVAGTAGDALILGARNGLVVRASASERAAPLFLVQFDDFIRRSAGRAALGNPRFDDDCLWQPAYWTAG